MVVAALVVAALVVAAMVVNLGVDGTTRVVVTGRLDVAGRVDAELEEMQIQFQQPSEFFTHWPVEC